MYPPEITYNICTYCPALYNEFIEAAARGIPNVASYKSFQPNDLFLLQYAMRANNQQCIAWMYENGGISPTVAVIYMAAYASKKMICFLFDSRIIVYSKLCLKAAFWYDNLDLFLHICSQIENMDDVVFNILSHSQIRGQRNSLYMYIRENSEIFPKSVTRIY